MTFNLKVTSRERITLPAGTFDTYRIEADGRNLKSGAQVIRTAWVAPETVPGYVAVEQRVKQDDRVLVAERTEPPNSAARDRQGGLLPAPRRPAARDRLHPAINNRRRQGGPGRLRKRRSKRSRGWNRTLIRMPRSSLPRIVTEWPRSVKSPRNRARRRWLSSPAPPAGSDLRSHGCFSSARIASR